MATFGIMLAQARVEVGVVLADLALLGLTIHQFSLGSTRLVELIVSRR